MPNLYHTLFTEHESADTSNNSDDISMEIINQMYGHMNFDALSEYFDISSYNKLVSPHDNAMLNIFHMNSRSLPKNFDHIQAFLKNLNKPPDILTLTETWLTPTNKHLYEFPGYHSHHLIRHTRAQGGVSVFVSDNIQSLSLPDLSMVTENIEINTVKIFTEAFCYLICSIYRPNSKHVAVEEFTHTLNAILQNINTNNSKIVLIGDFNINLLEHTTHMPTNSFLTTMQSINFIPHIARPTRFPDSIDLGEPSLLDHIYTNFSNHFNAGIIHYPISDHLPIFLNISIPAKHHKLHKIEFRYTTQVSKADFAYRLNCINWNELLSFPDININCNILSRDYRKFTTHVSL